LPRIAPEAMSEAQRRVYDEIRTGPRAKAAKDAGGLFDPWLRSPEMAMHAQRLGAFVRYKTSMPKRLSELAILVTARSWSCPFEWVTHEEEARGAGLAPDIMRAIARRETPRFAAADEAAVYEFSRALHERRGVGDDAYRTAVEQLGEQGVVELVGLLGYYTLVAMTLNAFKVAIPPEAAPPFEDAGRTGPERETS